MIESANFAFFFHIINTSRSDLLYFNVSSWGKKYPPEMNTVIISEIKQKSRLN